MNYKATTHENILKDFSQLI